jgi:predicted nucleic acid-binding protein
MRRVAVDANVVVRFLTGDPPDMAQTAADLFAAADRGEIGLELDEIVLAETVWVLHSFYGQPAADIARTLQQLLSHAAIHVDDEALLIEALALFAEHNVDFADALLAARMRRRGTTDVVSFDRHFDRLPGIRRVEPGTIHPTG